MNIRARAVLLIFGLVLASNASGAIPISERSALIAFYNATGGANWTNRTNWLGTAGTECTWFGVTCAGTAVVQIDLEENNLDGTIPTEITQLTGLASLRLRNNKLRGSIPANIGSLASLGELLLAGNPLMGGIPDSMGQLINLNSLYLNDTQLGGSIPSSIGNLVNLVNFVAENAKLTGTIPASLGNLTNLKSLYLALNNLTGGIPTTLGNLSKLENLSISDTSVGGPIPIELANLKNLINLGLYRNKHTGTIPPGIGGLTNLESLSLGENYQMTGTIPESIGNLNRLRYLNLAGNKCTGGIPSSFSNLTNLVELDIYDTSLDGPIPIGLANLNKLQTLILYRNELTGGIPPELGSLQALKYLDLQENHLTGQIPSSLGNLTGLNYLYLYNNALTGEVPASLAGLTNLLDDQGLDLHLNGLFTTSDTLRAFLDQKQVTPLPFEALQTLPPTSVSTTQTSPTSIRADWTPIAYQNGSGGYRVEIATSPIGPFTLATTTANKSASSAIVTGLQPSTQYFVRLSTVTFGGSSQKNIVTSAATNTVSVTTTPSQPAVVLIDSPSLLTVLADGTSTASTSYTLSNVGQTSTQIQLTQSGSFFTQSPTSFVLGAGATQRVTITSLPQSSSTSFRGSSTPSGNGVPSSIVVPVALLAAAPPTSGEPQVIVVTRRVDVSGPSNSNPTGSVTFKNIGTAAATGLLSADVPWIVPDPATLVIAPGEQKTATFTINRLRRPDSDALAGTASATLSFVYLTRNTTSAPGKAPFASPPSLVAPVTIGDTVQPTVTSTGIPLLQEGETGLVIPGVGNVTGSVGVFISDISIGNATSGLPASDLQLYYLSAGTALSATQPVAAGSSLNLADVVSTVFGKSEQIGVLHVRSSLTQQLGVNATVLNKSSSAGTYGTAIPVFRTNRALAKSETLMLTGLRKTATSHTNLYLQEVSGKAATADVTFLNASGQSLGVLENQALGAFGTTIIGQALVPEGSVTALVSNDGEGSIVAYATPVDRASGDTWAVADWNRFFGRAGTEEQVIPVAGSAPGRNNTYFRTDVSIANPGTVTASGTLRYYQQAPVVSVVDKTVTLNPLTTLTIDDAVVGFFNQVAPSVGHVVLIPDSGGMSMTSRTYTTVQGTPQTFGTGVPVLTRTDSLRIGQTRVIGGLKDSTAATTNGARPATFRTNVGLVETEGKSVTARVSVLFFDGKSLASGGAVAAKTYTLAANEFRQLNAIVAEIIGSTRETDYGDLDNVQVKVEVTAGDGGLIVYATATDNGSGDTVLRVE